MSGVAGTRPVFDDISVVIPTLGRETLVECLERIADGDAWPARVILVDQGDNPLVAEWVAGQTGRGLAVEHHRAPRRGRAAAVNRGLERVRTRFVAITDDDCFVAPDWLRRLAEHLRRTPDTIVTGRVEPLGEEEVVALVTSRVPATYRRPRLRHDSLSGGNMGAAMTVLEKIGPLDEDPCLATAEDCEYSYRALRRGVPIAYAPDVLVTHLGWRDAGQREATYRSYARSRAGFYGKYLRRGDWFIALRVGVQLLRSSRRWLAGVVTGDAERVLNGRANVMGLVPGLVAGWRKGRSS
ncbi:MAG: glycosyltransferase family 2 protein [Gemmatimonadota bacterium]